MKLIEYRDSITGDYYYAIIDDKGKETFLRNLKRRDSKQVATLLGIDFIAHNELSDALIDLPT